MGEESVVLFGANMFQTFDCLFVKTFCQLCLLYFVAFGEFVCQKFVTNRVFGWNFCIVQQDIFHPHQDYGQLSFSKNRLLSSLVGPSDTEKSQLSYNWLKDGPFSEKLSKTSLLSTLSNTSWCYAKTTWKSKVCSRCRFWIYRFGEKQRYKYLLIF